MPSGKGGWGDGILAPGGSARLGGWPVWRRLLGCGCGLGARSGHLKTPAIFKNSS